jgi:amylosucrase
MLSTPQQAITALFYVKAKLRASSDPAVSSLLDDESFVGRLDHHFVTIYGIFTELYGYRVDCLDHIVSLVQDLAESWRDRPADMKGLDEARLADPEWFLNNHMLGGVCYVDLYAGNLDGIIRRIPYFKELGLTYVHLMPLFKAPQPKNDGGYAVSSYRDVDPRLGNFEGFKKVAKALRDAGISLVIDFVFNHTSNEHEWAQRAVKGETEYEGYYWIFPDRNVPNAFEQTT